MTEEPISLLRALNAESNVLISVLKRAGVTNPKFLNWYNAFVDLSTFVKTVEYAFQQNYEFDPNSGLFLRQPFTEEQTAQMGRTIVDIILLRPTDLHYHKDVDEIIRVRSGEGRYLMKEKGAERADVNKLREALYVPKEIVHSFTPEPGHYLEIEVICSGILDPKQEITEQPFDETPWMLNFQSHRHNKTRD